VAVRHFEIARWALFKATVAGLCAICAANGSHPFIDRAGQSQASRRTRAARSPHSSMSPFPSHPSVQSSSSSAPRIWDPVRRLATQHAIAAGLEDRATDLALAANELVTNSLRHAGGEGMLRLWQQDRALVLEVTDQGHLDDRLVGRRRPGRAQLEDEDSGSSTSSATRSRYVPRHRAPPSASTSGPDSTQVITPMTTLATCSPLVRRR
jgi:hypothetical protein